MTLNTLNKPEILSKSDFAARQGWRKSYVTKLSQEDRLVMDEQGMVVVEASLKRIAETADPNRDDVVQRHAKERAAKAQGAQSPKQPEDPELKKAARGFNAARAEKEHFLALTAKLEYERAIGKVVDAEAVKHAGTEAGAALRSRLENLSDQLAPLLAPILDEDEVRRLLDDHVELLLTEISEKFVELLEQTTKPDTSE